MNITNKKITIIGAKRSGRALAKLVLRHGGIPRISDQGPQTDNAFSTWLSAHQVAAEFDGHTQDFIIDTHLLVISPGVPKDAPLMRWAKESGIPLLGEIEFAYQFCQVPVIAVTGSNGKTTTSTLISKVCQAGGKATALCGNVGFPFSDFADNPAYEWIVLEVSSFQMESLVKENEIDLLSKRGWEIRPFTPLIALLCNINQNHLDRHKDMDEYFEAKTKIFMNQDAGQNAVVNAEDAYCQKIIGRLKGQVHLYYPSRSARDGHHWDANQMAVAQVAQILHIADPICEEVFENFTGVEHRLEQVAVIDGVTFINDSKSTTAEATIWALAHIDQPVYLICGGKDKNIDYRVVLPWIQQKVAGVFVLGQASDKIEAVVSDCLDPVKCADLREAVTEAFAQASKNSVVLLSPMCASYDMFDNFEHRGRCFKECVSQLQAYLAA